MRILADSHVVYWAMTRPDEIVPSAQKKLIDPDNDILVSAASIWELEIKARKGRLYLPDGFMEALREEHFDVLPITWRHAQATSDLPMIHSDPFDRLLIAQALAEGLILMTRDETIHGYDVPICRA